MCINNTPINMLLSRACREFQKGHSGKPKGAKNRKTLIAQEFAHDVLYLDPETGKQMSYHELCLWAKRKTDTSPQDPQPVLRPCLGQTPRADPSGTGGVHHVKEEYWGSGCRGDGWGSKISSWGQGRNRVGWGELIILTSSLSQNRTYGPRIRLLFILISLNWNRNASFNWT